MSNHEALHDIHCPSDMVRPSDVNCASDFVWVIILMSMRQVGYVAYGRDEICRQGFGGET